MSRKLVTSYLIQKQSRLLFFRKDQNDAELYEGACFSIDCVSEYMDYHGDFARAVHIGEPTKQMKNVTDLTGMSWDILRDTIKLGLRFSQIRAMGKDILKKLGADVNISFTPNSFGLYHSNHVGRNGSGNREDIVVEPNMVISIDCPMGSTGMEGISLGGFDVYY